MKKKLFGIILSLVMAITFMPNMAFAGSLLPVGQNTGDGLWVSQEANVTSFDDIYNGWMTYTIGSDEDMVIDREYIYRYMHDKGTITPWDLGTDSFKIQNELGKDVTSKFSFLTDEDNGQLYMIVNSERTTGYFKFSYVDENNNKCHLWFEANTWDNIKSVAKANKTTLTVKAGKKQATLKMSFKGEYDIDGYQIYKSTKKNSGFKKVTNTSNTSYTNKKLKSKKTYYYKARTYKVYNGKYYYGKWSKVVKVKVK